MSEMFSRRSFLKLSGALVAASALAACSGGGGGSTGGGGDKPYVPTEYVDIVEGLSISRPSMTGKATGQGGTLTFFSLTFNLKNKTGSAITLSGSNFDNILFNDQIPAKFTGIGNYEQTEFSVPVSESYTPVTVFFSPKAQTTLSLTHIKFSLLYGGKTVTCEGDTSSFSAWTIDVQDSK